MEGSSSCGHRAPELGCSHACAAAAPPPGLPLPGPGAGTWCRDLLPPAPRSRLIPGLHASQQAAAAAAPPPLDALCPAMPLDVFSMYDVAAVADVQPRTQEQVAAGLPRDLHLALLSAMMFAEMGGAGMAGQG